MPLAKWSVRAPAVVVMPRRPSGIAKEDEKDIPIGCLLLLRSWFGGEGMQAIWVILLLRTHS